jgi:hypothetical protein
MISTVKQIQHASVGKEFVRLGVEGHCLGELSGRGKQQSTIGISVNVVSEVKTGRFAGTEDNNENWRAITSTLEFGEQLGFQELLCIDAMYARNSIPRRLQCK